MGQPHCPGLTWIVAINWTVKHHCFTNNHDQKLTEVGRGLKLLVEVAQNAAAGALWMGPCP